MSIKVLCQLINDNYLPDIDPNHKQYHEKFEQSQFKFTDQFDYFVGTSTGGLIAMCLAAKYPILKIQEIYKNPSGYFTKNRLNGSRLFGWLGDIMSAKYNDKNIHDKINQVIDDIFEGKLYDGKPLTAQNATLLDLHNLLNPHHMVNDNAFELSHQYHGNLLEFVDNKPFTTDCKDAHQGDNPQFVKREKVLLITAYNTTTSNITVFNTSFAEHWSYRIADVLKATMAAPTYFPPWSMFKGRKENGNFVQDDEEQVFIDGGVFANDPELIALWTIRIQWKKVSNYRLLSIGTGCYNPQLPTSSWGGYYTWLFQTHRRGLVIDTLMDATRSLTETITKNLAKLDDIKRMRFNYKLTQPLNLDDSDFPSKFDQEWETLKQGPDYKALCYFYTTYIEKKTMKTDS
jgi:patatin-like phospholipase/acyl hydrolase